jgi:hypothetical protein
MLFQVSKLFVLIKHKILAHDKSCVRLTMAMTVQELLFPFIVLELRGWNRYFISFLHYHGNHITLYVYIYMK